MAIVKKLLWLLPLLGLIYMYANQGVGVILGSPEHHDILAPMGLSASLTSALVWASVVIDLGGALLALFFPSARTFLFLGLWTWVPRIITGVYGGAENEIMESLAVSVLALLSYLAWKRGHSIPAKRLFAGKQPPFPAA